MYEKIYASRGTKQVGMSGSEQVEVHSLCESQWETAVMGMYVISGLILHTSFSLCTKST